MRPGFRGYRRWAFLSVEFPSETREGHLVISASPRPVAPLQFMSLLPSPHDRLDLAASVRLRNTKAQIVRVLVSDGSIFQRHTVLLWTEAGHSYAVGFHGLDREAQRLDLQIAEAFDSSPHRRGRDRGRGSNAGPRGSVTDQSPSSIPAPWRSGSHDTATWPLRPTSTRGSFPGPVRGAMSRARSHVPPAGLDDLWTITLDPSTRSQAAVALPASSIATSAELASSPGAESHCGGVQGPPGPRVVAWMR